MKDGHSHGKKDADPKKAAAMGKADADPENRGTELKAPDEKCSFDEADGKTNGGAG